MRIFIRRISLSRFVQRTLILVLSVTFASLAFASPLYSVHAASDDPQSDKTFGSLVKEVFRQMDGVASFTAQAVRAVFDRAEAKEEQELPAASSTAERGRVTASVSGFATDSSKTGTLIINTPLLLSDRLTVHGVSGFATTSVSGPFTGTDGVFETFSSQNGSFGALQVSGSVSAGDLSGQSLSIENAAQIGSLEVLRAALLSELSVAGSSTLAQLAVDNLARLTTLVVTGETTLQGLLLANDGILTNGADVDLGAGSIFASNIIYEIVAGDGVVITGSSSAPTISVEASGVTEFNGETGEVVLRAGDDITISGLRIENDSTLDSVRGRGGCTGCILDADVANTLTLTDGSIDGVIIGASETAAAYFSTVAVGTTTATTSVFHVYGTATSTFAAGIDIESGCFSINGACIAGASSTLYTASTDTPDTLLPDAIQYVNGAGTAITQSADFVYTGSALGVGSSSPSATLTVDGTAWVTGTLTTEAGLVLRDRAQLQFYDADSSNYAALRASTSLTSDVVWTLPATDGSANEILVTDGNGQLSFADLDTLSGVIDTFIGLTDTPNSYATGSIPYVGTNSLLFATDFVFDGSGLGIGTSSPSATLAVDGTTWLTGAVSLGANASLLDQAQLRFYDSGSGNYVGFVASSSVTNTLWTLPDSDGFSDNVLVTDGNGNLRFEPVTSVGGGVDTYLELTDTPSSFIAGAIPYASSSANALLHSANLRYTGSYFGIGATVPSAELTVDGSVDFVASNGSIDFTFNDVQRRVGIGTDSPTDKLTVMKGSILQIGGSNSSTYSPTLIRNVSLDDRGTAIAIYGGYAYVTSYTTGDDLQIFDLANVENPVEVGAVGLAASTNGVAVEGAYAYAVSAFAGNDFHVIDISDPTAPIEVDSIDLPASANAVALSGNYAYVVIDGSAQTLQVVDISDPNNVAVVGTTSLPANGLDIAIKGDYAYVTTSLTGDDFHVIDISDPTAPIQVDSLGLPETTEAVVISGSYAYVGTQSTGNDLHVIDISDPTNISEVNSIELGVSVLDIYLTGGLLYISSYSNGHDLQVVDITSPTSPQLIGGVDLGNGDAAGVAVVGKTAYVAAVGGLSVVDVSGAELQSVLTNSLRAGTVMVAGVADFSQNIHISGDQFTSGNIASAGFLKITGDGPSIFSGSLSIGTTSSSTGLLVDGTVNFPNLSTNTGAGSLCLTADGEVVYNSGSDNCLTSTRDTKHDITELRLATSSIDLLAMLEPVSFKYNIDPTERTRYGFIADDAVMVDKHLGTYNYDNILTGLDTNGFLALIVGAVQEMWARLQGVEKDVSTLKTQVQELETLRTRVSELESQLDETNETNETNQSTQTVDTATSTVVSATTSVEITSEVVSKDLLDNLPVIESGAETRSDNNVSVQIKQEVVENSADAPAPETEIIPLGEEIETLPADTVSGIDQNIQE